MGNFWDTMNKIGRTLEDIDDLAGDVKQTTSTAKYGYGKVRDSAEYFTNMPRNIEANLKQIEEYGIKKRKYKTRTTIFCVLVIVITVGICVFL